MSVLIRFKINPPQPAPPSYEDIAARLASVGRGTGDERPEFLVWGSSSYPDSTVIEYLRDASFATALERVRVAIERADVDRYCTGGDLHIDRAF